MSKIQLKKEIAGMTKEQLEQIILDAYSARKEFKKYFDFFLNPDPEKLYDRYKLEIAKELDRSKRGYSKGRISVIKRLIADFDSYQPGYTYRRDLLLFVVAYGILSEQRLHFPDTLIRGIESIMIKALDLADSNSDVEHTVTALNDTLDDTRFGSRYFRNHLRAALQSHLASATPSPQ